MITAPTTEEVLNLEVYQETVPTQDLNAAEPGTRLPLPATPPLEPQPPAPPVPQEADAAELRPIISVEPAKKESPPEPPAAVVGSPKGTAHVNASALLELLNRARNGHAVRQPNAVDAGISTPSTEFTKKQTEALPMIPPTRVVEDDKIVSNRIEGLPVTPAPAMPASLPDDGAPAMDAPQNGDASVLPRKTVLPEKHHGQPKQPVWQPQESPALPYAGLQTKGALDGSGSAKTRFFVAASLLLLPALMGIGVFFQDEIKMRWMTYQMEKAEREERIEEARQLRKQKAESGSRKEPKTAPSGNISKSAKPEPAAATQTQVSAPEPAPAPTPLQAAAGGAEEKAQIPPPTAKEPEIMRALPVDPATLEVVPPAGMEGPAAKPETNNAPQPAPSAGQPPPQQVVPPQPKTVIPSADRAGSDGIFETLAEENPGTRPALSALDRFLKAKNWQERLEFVQKPKDTRWLMERYYQSAGDGPLRAAGVQVIPRDPSADDKNAPAYHLFRIWGGDFSSEIPVMVEESESGWRVDWLAFVEFKDRLLQKFYETQDKLPRRFRVLLRRKTYFAGMTDYEVPNAGSRACYELQTPVPGFVGYAFVEPGTELMAELDRRVGWDVLSAAMVVELQWRFGDGQKRWVELTGLPGVGWRMKEPVKSVEAGSGASEPDAS